MGCLVSHLLQVCCGCPRSWLSWCFQRFPGPVGGVCPSAICVPTATLTLLLTPPLPPSPPTSTFSNLSLKGSYHLISDLNHHSVTSRKGVYPVSQQHKRLQEKETCAHQMTPGSFRPTSQFSIQAPNGHRQKMATLLKGQRGTLSMCRHSRQSPLGSRSDKKGEKSKPKSLSMFVSGVRGHAARSICVHFP